MESWNKLQFSKNLTITVAFILSNFWTIETLCQMTSPENTKLPQGGTGPNCPFNTLPEISLINRHADQPRKLRVTVIGAGISGIIAGVLLPAKVPGIDLTIFEKNADVVSVI